MDVRGTKAKDRQGQLGYLAGREPVAIVDSCRGFIALATVFGWWHWSPGQEGAVLALVGAGLAFARGLVTPLQAKRGAA